MHIRKEEWLKLEKIGQETNPRLCLLIGQRTPDKANDAIFYKRYTQAYTSKNLANYECIGGFCWAIFLGNYREKPALVAL